VRRGQARPFIVVVVDDHSDGLGDGSARSGVGRSGTRVSCRCCCWARLCCRSSATCCTPPSSLSGPNATPGAGLHRVPRGEQCQEHGNAKQREDDQPDLIVADRCAELGEDNHYEQASGPTAGAGGN